MKNIILKNLNGSKSILDELKDKGVYIVADCNGRGTCGNCKVYINGKWLKACETYFNEDVEVGIPDGDESIHVETEATIFPIEANKEGKAICIDIGTTTVVAVLVDCKSGNILGKATTINHQRMFGSDVISRIDSVCKGKGQQLQNIIRKDIEKLITQLDCDEEKQFIIVGNTTMEHLLLGYSCETLGVYPYTPVDISLKKYKAAVILPGISTYVGADIVSGICAVNMDISDEVCALIDLGTNGEMAIGNKDKILVASTAAGPAFEGGNIQCGIAGIPGAISGMQFEKGKVVIKTIDDMEPKGICGSGVIEIVYELMKSGNMDETGLLDEDFFDNGFILYDNIAFTEKDIREVQMAKAAIRAGFETLAKEYGIKIDEIKNLYIAGGFGQKIDVNKTVGIGMIPPKLKEKTVSVGNSSLAGAVKYACDGRCHERFVLVSENAQEINLASNKAFNEFYMEYMYFEEE